MFFYTYVLKNQSSNKIYIGQTEYLDKRLKKHNDKSFDKRSYTKLNKGQWNIVHKEQFKTRKEAIKKEKYLKSHHGIDWPKTVMVR